MKLLRIQEVAELLGVHRETVLRWIRRGWVPVVRVNSRTLRVRSDDMETIIKSIQR